MLIFPVGEKDEKIRTQVNARKIKSDKSREKEI